MIPVYQPWLTDLEKKYVNQAIDSSWISSTGKFVDKAEELFADFIGVKYAVLTTSGTTALHLCLRAIDHTKDIKPHNSQTVVVPNTTFIATAFAASYDRRRVLFIDSDKKTWNMDLDLLQDLLTKRPIDTVIPVHLYGNPVDMKRLLVLQKKYGFSIIEDACEALGATIDGSKAGSFGDASCFSFYGNKTFTCGEGGALATDNGDIAKAARLLRGQAQDPNKRYWHVDIGYNYRLTNVQAAILCGQLERADEILERKEHITERYKKALGGHFEFQNVLPGHQHSNWIITLKLASEYAKIAPLMRARGIDTREIFYPITDMPPYSDNLSYPVSSELSKYGISLPSYPELTDKEIDYICNSLLFCTNY